MSKSRKHKSDDEFATKPTPPETTAVADHSSGAADRTSSDSQKKAKGIALAVTERSASSRDALADATASAARSTKAAANRASRATKRVSSVTLRATTAASQATVSATKRAATATVGAGQRASRAALTAGSAVHTRSLEALAPIATKLSATTQNLLATSLSTDLNDLVQNLVQGSATMYDKAMDAAYNSSHVGGYNHRLFDEGHTVLGAIRALQEAKANNPSDFENEGFLDQVEGLFHALVKDASTQKGVPYFTWDKETYDKVAGAVNELGIPKQWFADLNTYDPAELLGTTIVAMTLVFRWNKADAEEFARLAAGVTVSGLASANALVLIVSVVALARAFHLSRRDGNYSVAVDGFARGAAVSGTTLAAVAAIGAGAGWSILVGLTVGILAHQAADHVSVSEVSRFVSEKTISSAAGLKAMMDRQTAVRASEGATP